MTRYRKKPVVIEAVQLPFYDKGAPEWVGSDPNIIMKRDGGKIIEATISTREGVMTASEGDWIIRGVKGELYPCKPDIFAATYDPA